MKSIIVSYFSDVGDSTYYSDHGKRLSKELEKLGDRYSIVGLKGHDDYRANCLSKPLFIREMYHKYKQNIVWLDVDSLVHKSLDMFDWCLEKAKVACVSHHGAHQKVAPQQVTMMKASPIGFQYCDEVTTFIDGWVDDCQNDAKNGGNRFDHEVLLENTLPRFADMLTFILLDNRWCRWPGLTDSDTYITMGLADNESKRKGLIDMGVTGDTLNNQLVGNDRMERDYENASGGQSVQPTT
jgi:hypothetical protein